MHRWIGGVTRTDLTSWEIPNETGSESRDPLSAKAEVQGSLMHDMFVITLDLLSKSETGEPTRINAVSSILHHPGCENSDAPSAHTHCLVQHVSDRDYFGSSMRLELLCFLEACTLSQRDPQIDANADFK